MAGRGSHVERSNRPVARRRGRDPSRVSADPAAFVVKAEMIDETEST